jgi:hypothetical protein
VRSILGSGCGNGVFALTDERFGQLGGARGSREGGVAMAEAVGSMPWRRRRTRLPRSAAMARAHFSVSGSRERGRKWEGGVWTAAGTLLFALGSRP